MQHSPLAVGVDSGNIATVLWHIAKKARLELNPRMGRETTALPVISKTATTPSPCVRQSEKRTDPRYPSSDDNHINSQQNLI
ncbi:hypothetical protein ACLKA7_014843 [Drosophila subpalustris]